MTLPGGPADKRGNRYEKWWTVSEFLRMLGGSTEAIRIEDPGVEKAEFVVTIGRRRELHQAKRSHPNGKWSLSSLARDGLLQSVGDQLEGNEDRFVFISGSSVPELSDLCEAASDAESFREFERRFLAAEGRRKRFVEVVGRWGCDHPSAMERLGRIRVQTIGDRDLEQMVRYGIQALFLANTDKVKAELLSIVEDSVHRKWGRQELVRELSSRGYSMRKLPSPESAGAALEAATDRYLSGARSKLIQQERVARAATASLVARLEGIPTDSVLTGRAGSGKTACAIEIVDRLREEGLPVLAFRLDRVPFLSVSTTTDLGRHLGLEESPVLVLAGAAEAAGRPGVLIVDQLDAVSTMSGRSSGAFDLVEQLLQEARGTRSRAVIHTTVVCRAFDWENDSRLRQLMPDCHAQIEVIQFAVEEVTKILANAGFDPALFRERQLELLRLPQNLSLFLEAGFDDSQAPAFNTATELLDRYWIKRRQAAAIRAAPSPDQWMEVMEILCREMASVQQLSVPKEGLDAIQPDYVDSMASEGVLTFDGRRYGFGHESFFDYCFARLFATRPASLVSFLRESEQHLFRRAQVRQVLVYLREADPDRYTGELDALLSDGEIRAHIKDLAFAVLAEVAEPSEQESRIREKWTTPALKAIEQGTPNLDKVSEMGWRRFSTASSWFADIDQRGTVEGWLASGNERLADEGIRYLAVHQRHSPDRVAELLEPYADRGGDWVRRLQSVMEWAEYKTSRSFFDLFLRLVDNGTLDDAQGPIAMESTSVLHDLAGDRPEWVPELLAHRMRRSLAVIRTADGDLRGGKLLDYDQSPAEELDRSAERAPGAFVEHLLPVVLEVSERACSDGGEPPRHDRVWGVLVKTDHPSGEDACLSALGKALSQLAHQGVDLRDVICDLRGRDTHIANHLLLALYRGGAGRYADAAVSVLCEDPWRFQCGFSDSANWCAMELIRAVVPNCGAESRKRLERLMLCYLSPYERTPHGYRQAGRTRFDLLSAIPEELRSDEAKGHLKEQARKFGEPAEEPRTSCGGWVRSPIEGAAATKMTDEQWLGAVRKYRTEEPEHWSPDELKGGASQLAQVLEARVRDDPDRFACLSLRFPADANPVYLKRTLDGLTGTSVEGDLKLQVCRKAFAESRGPCGQSIAECLGSIEDTLPDDAVQMLHWLATEHEDPGEVYYDGDIYTRGINTTRGRAAEAIGKLIGTGATSSDRFLGTLDRAIRDPSPPVISCVAGILRAVARHDTTLAVSLFQRMNLAEERLLATPHVYGFLRDRLRDDYSQLEPIVQRMLRSSEPGVGEAGGSLASIANLLHESAADLADEALRGCVAHRLGVAKVASTGIAYPVYRAWCEARLGALFNDEDARVRREAASCFTNLGDGALSTYEDLIRAFCDSRACDNSIAILRRLEESRGRLPGMTCVVCGKLLDRLSDAARDVPTKRLENARAVVKIVFRTYQQHQSDEWTCRSLDLIDRLCLEGVSAAGEFEQFER